MTTEPTVAPKMENAWGLEPGTMVRFKDGAVHRVKVVSGFTHPKTGLRKIYYDHRAEPYEVAIDTLVEIVEVDE